jgi:MFS family permease
MVFGLAVFGFVVGPRFGGVADLVGLRPAFAVIALVAAASITYGGFYTPGMALVADRAERAGLSQGIGFGLTNTAWALGAVTGPAVGGALAEAFGDAVPYLACGALCALTLVAAVRGTARLRPA